MRQYLYFCTGKRISICTFVLENASHLPIRIRLQLQPHHVLLVVVLDNIEKVVV
jgi:hypothetical protein